MTLRPVTVSPHNVLLVLVIAFFVLTNLSWIARDARPMSVVDSYTQASNVLRAVDSGWPTRPDDIATRIRTLSQGGRPPLYELTTIPFVLAFGRSEDAIISVNLVYLGILMLGVYGLANSVAGRTAGFAAMIAIASFPPIAQLAREYRSYFGAIAAIAVTLCFLVLVLRDRKASAVWLAASACTVALLIHPLSVWILLLPMATTWILVALNPKRTSAPESRRWVGTWAVSWGRDPSVLKVLLPAAILPVAATIWWYSTFGERLVRFAETLRSGWLESFRGGEQLVSGFASVPADLRWYPLTSPFVISLPLALGTVIAAVWLLFKGRPLGRALVLWLTASYVLIPVMGGFHWSYGAFAFPLVAAVLGSAAATVPSGWRRSTAVSLVVIVSLLNFSIVTWGTPVLPDQIRRPWGVWGKSQVLLGPHPAVESRWPIGDVVADLVHETAGSQENDAMVFSFLPKIPYNLLGFTLLQHWPETEIQIKGERSPFWGASYPVDQLLGGDFIIVRFPLSDVCSQPTTNPYLSATACLFQNPPQEFSASHSEVGQYRLPDEGVIQVWRRTSPVTVEEIDATLKSLDLQPKFTGRAFLLAASILERDGRLEEAAARLLEGSNIEGQPPATTADIWSVLGMLFLKMGKNDAAIEACTKAVELAPDHAALLTRLGIVYGRSGRIPEAKGALKEAIRLAPDMRWPRQVLERLEANQD